MKRIFILLMLLCGASFAISTSDFGNVIARGNTTINGTYLNVSNLLEVWGNDFSNYYPKLFVNATVFYSNNTDTYFFSNNLAQPVLSINGTGVFIYYPLVAEDISGENLYLKGAIKSGVINGSQVENLTFISNGSDATFRNITLTGNMTHDYNNITSGFPAACPSGYAMTALSTGATTCVKVAYNPGVESLDMGDFNLFNVTYVFGAGATLVRAFVDMNAEGIMYLGANDANILQLYRNGAQDEALVLSSALLNATTAHLSTLYTTDLWGRPLGGGQIILHSNMTGNGGNVTNMSLVQAVDGNFSNLSQGVAIRYMFAHSNTTQCTAGAGSVWFNISFNETALEHNSGFLHTFNDGTNATFTVQTAGHYFCTLQGNFRDSGGAGCNVNIRGILNNQEIPYSANEGDAAVVDDDFGVTTSFDFIANANDQLAFQFIADCEVVCLQSPHGVSGAIRYMSSARAMCQRTG